MATRHDPCDFLLQRSTIANDAIETAATSRSLPPPSYFEDDDDFVVVTNPHHTQVTAEKEVRAVALDLRAQDSAKNLVDTTRRVGPLKIYRRLVEETQGTHGDELKTRIDHAKKLPLYREGEMQREHGVKMPKMREEMAEMDRRMDQKVEAVNEWMGDMNMHMKMMNRLREVSEQGKLERVKKLDTKTAIVKGGTEDVRSEREMDRRWGQSELPKLNTIKELGSKTPFS